MLAIRTGSGLTKAPSSTYPVAVVEDGVAGSGVRACCVSGVPILVAGGVAYEAVDDVVADALAAGCFRRNRRMERICLLACTVLVAEL